MNFQSIVNEFVVMIPGIVDHIVSSIMIIFVFYCLCKAVNENGVLAKKFLAKADPSIAETIGRVLFLYLRRIIGIVGLMTLAGEWGFDLRPLLASLGVVSMAGALAAQDIVKNFFGTFIIIAGDIFRVGDKISVTGVTGVVESLNFRSTQIRTEDGSVVYVPNATFSSSNVTKFRK